MTELPLATTVEKKKLLDRPLPIALRALLLLLCALIPTAYVVKQYEIRHDLTQMILFGQGFEDRALPEIRALHPAIVPRYGYDGQFYAQIAIDPTLRRPELSSALDDPGYREQRILLPFLAHVLGLGSPGAVVFAYALLNLIFWYILFIALARYLRVASIKSFLVFIAIMLTPGAIISIAFSLTDLPSATFGFLSFCLGDTPAALFISMAILTKPSGILFLTRYLSPLPRSMAQVPRAVGSLLLALLLPVFWYIYICFRIGKRPSGGDNFGLPFVELVQRIGAAWHILVFGPAPKWELHSKWEFHFFEFLSLLALAFQGAFLLLCPRWQNRIWLMGVGFAVLFFCLNHNVYVGQTAFTRTVMPLTIAFNLLLLESKRTSFFLLFFILGNVGLLYFLQVMLSFVLFD